MTHEFAQARPPEPEELTSAQTVAAHRDADTSPTVSRVTLDATQVVVNLPLTSITPSPYQPRRMFDPVALQELASSIAQHGRVLQPILVRPAANAAHQSAARFELVAGERRLRS